LLKRRQIKRVTRCGTGNWTAERRADAAGLRITTCRCTSRSKKPWSGPHDCSASASIRWLQRNQEKCQGASFGAMVKEPLMGMPGTEKVSRIVPESSLA
jgi:hypothetical protein